VKSGFLIIVPIYAKVSNNPVKIINKVKTALSHWGNLASEYGVSNTQRLVIGQELARMRKNET
jgi:hypothetical protein